MYTISAVVQMAQIITSPLTGRGDPPPHTHTHNHHTHVCTFSVRYQRKPVVNLDRQLDIFMSANVSTEIDGDIVDGDISFSEDACFCSLWLTGTR